MALAINTELLRLYWRMGADICEKQKSASWGDGWLKDQFYNEQLTIWQQAVFVKKDIVQVVVYHLGFDVCRE